MKRVGIITHYYNSINYGGVLQAFALCKVLNNMNCNAEQIQFLHKTTNLNPRTRWRIPDLEKVISRLYTRINKEKISHLYQKRQAAFAGFRDCIPHCNMIYTNESIKSCVDNYDIFITGSDQVWNLGLYNPAYFLDFVDHKKKKVSYAASFSMNLLTDEQKRIVEKSLASFDSISVREKKAIKLLDCFLDIQKSLVLDPTLLLDSDEWEKLCVPIKERKYIFCYFLGGNVKERKIAYQFAKKYGYEIVNVPLANGYSLNYFDSKLQKSIYDNISPELFLSYIRNADFIFTDSFHALVFSYIFKKQFFAFRRNKKDTMISRIMDLLDLLHIKGRLCDGNESISDLYNSTRIDYVSLSNDLSIMKNKSLDFLIKVLGDDSIE